ncbi:hypothetical protein ACOME3_006305 [Neoechinorhynchus agilis]
MLIRKKRLYTNEFDSVFKERPPRLVSVRIGDKLIIPCSPNNPYILEWQKDDKPLKSSLRVYTTASGLVFDSILIEDIGLYTCRVLKGRKYISAAVKLSIESEPSVEFEERSIFPVQGSDFVLKCNVEGFPKPQVQWTKNGNPIIEGESYLSTKSYPHHNGLYTCIATNKLGSDEASCQVSVEEAVSPFISHKQKDTTARLGQQFVLECSSTGYPSPLTRWYQDNVPIEFDNRKSVLSDGSLKISSAHSSDSGRYMCIVENIVGTDQHSFNLKIIRADDIDVDDLKEMRMEAERSRNNITLTAYEDLAVETLPFDLKAIANLLSGSIGVGSIDSAERFYEQGMRILRRKIEEGINAHRMELPRPEHLRPPSIPSQHLTRLSTVTGCFPHQIIPANCKSKCQSYRSADGTCNNLKHKMWGASQTPFERYLPSEYDNNFNTPKGWNITKLHNGFQLPSPRLVSSKLISSPRITPDPAFTHMIMQWGQFVDHDFTHTLMATGTHTFSDARLCVSSCTREAPCYPISIPKDDPRIGQRGNCIEFVKSTDVCLTGETSLLNGVPIKREQINQITAFIDASNVYGSTEQEQHDLREHSYGRGLLRMRKDNRYKQRLLPFAVDTPVDCQRDRDARASPVGCFLAGDHRASEQLGLTAMHTIWARQHNRLAEKLGNLNPHWSDEQVFQETRKIVSAQMQHITYKHWLPLILGKRTQIEPYRGYNDSVNPSSVNVIATAVFRFGHTLINPIIYRLNASLEPINCNMIVSKASQNEVIMMHCRTRKYNATRRFFLSLEIIRGRWAGSATQRNVCCTFKTKG